MAIPLPPEPDSLPRVFLDPRGRLGRREFWLYGVLAVGGVSLLLRALTDIARLKPEHGEHVVNLLMMWPFIAVSIKRWHDRDKSGWWALLPLVPVVGIVWLMIENGFLRGTPGPNRFGAPFQPADR